MGEGRACAGPAPVGTPISDKGHDRHETHAHLVMNASESMKALFPNAARVICTRTVTFWKETGKHGNASRPRALAILRNLLMGLIRQADYDGAAAAIRAAEYDNDLLYALRRLTPDL
jgi:hypothetical protein